jgi:Domain of unknown function (DUF4845)
MFRQRGVTLSGFIVWAVIFFIFALMGFKVGPAYFEAMSIQKQFTDIAGDPSSIGASRRDIEVKFSNRSSIEDIKSIQASDLEISKDGDRIVISASYSVKVPLFANASACLDFNPTSAK